MSDISVNRIYASLVGGAYGDAYGMPTEGMSLEAIYECFEEGITEFIPSINRMISSRTFNVGEITDDTLHTLLLIDALYENSNQFTSDVYIKYLSDWYNHSSIANLVIGPSTLKAIEAYHHGEKNTDARYAVSNGAMMKISPIGFIAGTKSDILHLVKTINEPTHASNICITSASVVAYLVSCYCRKEKDLNDLECLSYEMIDYCKGVGFDMPSASLKSRIEIAINIAEEKIEESEFLLKLSNIIGTSIYCTETLPCALAIIKYANGEVRKVASLCASIGGDTDTIGAIACSICGSLGYLPETREIELLEAVNHIGINSYVSKVMQIKGSLNIK
ncbi:ADP-ribosylglycohydrolase family protein [Breznakia pachnodae]|uniref:ADP-ribosylglycohydrolase n=1 Tax=Breznakia pachnodae TaxID=265178 RepID=A0ABU0E4L7_9FIRM|nr:ADP-ribosylglycohydrolase family protein [Breznakia pachnodae]MDQ0361766.1 ADP-ribosylglycohydrolase [Breznakia pachnodae]